MIRRCVLVSSLLLIAASTAALGLDNVFGESNLGYTIEYPSGWVVERPGDFTVLFTGVAWTTASRVSLTIQNLGSTAMGGVYETTDDLLDALRCQLVTGAGDVCIYLGQPITVVDTSGRSLVGPQLVAEYEYGDDIYKEWIAIVPHGSGEVFYVLTYSAPRDDYDRYEPIILDMVATWTIGGTTQTSGGSESTQVSSGGEISILLQDSGHLGPYDYAASSYDKRYYDVVVTTPGYLAIAVLDEADESISGWIYTPTGVELMHKPGNYAEIYTDAYEVFPGTYELKVGQDTMVTESDFAVYVFFSTSPFTVEDLIAEFGSEYQVMP